MNNKPLTISQQHNLIALIERAKAAKKAIDEFIEYLRDEHAAPVQAGWAIADVQSGFVQAQEVSQTAQE